MLALWSRLSFSLLRAECIRIDPSWGETGIRWWFWRLYCFSGSGAEARIGRKVFAFEPRRLYLLPAGRIFERSARCEMDHGYVHFSVQGLPQERWLDIFPGVIAGERLEAVLSLDDSLDALALAVRAFGAAVSGLEPEKRLLVERSLSAPHRLEQARRFAEERVGRVSVSDLATQAGLSRDRFSRLFTEAYGVSPRRWLTGIRLQRAAQLLLQTSGSIEVIADATGFHDRAHLSRAFSQAFAIPPAAFRRRYRQDRVDLPIEWIRG